MGDALVSQEKLLKRAARERKEYKEKWECAMMELDFAKASEHVSDESECDACAVHMSNYVTLQSKYAKVLDERDELKSRPVLLGACKSCLGLRSELAEKTAKISLLEMASSEGTVVKCAK